MRGLCAGNGVQLVENAVNKSVTLNSTVALKSEIGTGGVSLVGGSNAPADPYIKYIIPRYFSVVTSLKKIENTCNSGWERSFANR